MHITFHLLHIDLITIDVILLNLNRCLIFFGGGCKCQGGGLMSGGGKCSEGKCQDTVCHLVECKLDIVHLQYNMHCHLYHYT